MGITITEHDVDVEDAARWLVEKYPIETVRFYDYANRDDRIQARSPADSVALEDLGRLVCVGASLTYKRGHTLIRDSDEAPWPDAKIPPMDEITDSGDGFYRHPAVEQLADLFDFWKSKRDLANGTVGKLLHIKWPEFIPVTDREFRKVYWKPAVKKHNESQLILQICEDARRRRTRANFRAYWAAFRDDLVSSRDALSELRETLRSFDDPLNRGPTAQGHVDRLLGLTNVRLLDALAWKIGADGALG